MEGFTFTRYLYPGLSDVGTIRIPREKAKQTEDWLFGDKVAARKLHSGNVVVPERSGFGGKTIPAQEAYAITFEDPRGDHLLYQLENRPDVNLQYYGMSDEALNEKAFNMLHSAKSSATSPDYMAKLSGQLPDYLTNPGQVDIERFKLNLALAQDPNYQNLGNRAFEQLQGAAAKAGLPVTMLDTPNFLQRYGDNVDADVDPNKIKFITGFTESDPAFASYNKQPMGIFLHQQDGKNPLSYAGAISEQLARQSVVSDGIPSNRPGGLNSWSASGQSKVGSMGQKGIDLFYDDIAPAHIQATKYGILRQVLGDNPNAQKLGYYDALAEMGRNAPDNLAQYVANPEFHNQVRSAAKYAGRLLL